ncbi:MAG: hypothetical protein LC802_11995 [Acidobacteria bacterium]|nr:hypothetical protein [Acidobacteriota bacterium]
MPLIGLAQSTAPELDKVEANPDEKMVVMSEKPASVKAESTIVAAPLELARKDATYASAYHDVYHILSAPNPCSSFFGGPSTAVEVLNTLFGQLETSKLSDTRTGLSMFGQTRSISNARTGANYRMFQKAVINTSGPFYQRKFWPADPFVPSVGSFQPNTREARASILLHELGHLLQGADGRWLLPNDGASDEQSRKNTITIEERCGEQIKTLRRRRADANTVAPQKGSGAEVPQ